MYRVSMIVALTSVSLTACNHNLLKTTNSNTPTTTTPNETQTTPNKPTKTVIKAKTVSAPNPVISAATPTNADPSPERSLKEIAEIPHFGKVDVFVNESIKAIVEITTESQLDIIQLHGNENEKFILQLRQILGNNIKIIKVIRIGNQSFDELQKTINQQPSTVNYLLFDTDSKTFGGTGKTFDWQILNEIEIPIPYFLSGGISLENIHQLSTINHQPLALDINSKFETEPGIKDLEKIKTFKSLLK